MDVLPKPIDGGMRDWQDLQLELITKIRVLSGVAVFTHRRQGRDLRRGTSQPVTARSKSVGLGQSSLPPIAPAVRQRTYELVTIGASTGGAPGITRDFTGDSCGVSGADCLCATY